MKAIWVNSPSNPTGAVLSAAQLHDIVNAAREIGAVVLSDECYALMNWTKANDDEGNREAAIESSPCALRADVCDGRADGVVVLYSLSKQSNMAGYRTALLAGDAQIISRMTAFRKQLGLIMPGPVQAAMAAGLRDAASVRAQHNRYHDRLGELVCALRGYGYRVNMPQGALYVWTKAKSADCWTDMKALASIGIIASPGEFYGAPEYLRFSATATDEQIHRACERLAQA